MDYAWWDKLIEEVRTTFVGERFSTTQMPKEFAVTHILKMESFGNSGAGAIHLAIKGGAKRIILLGFDCQHTNGQRHWHGHHPRGLGNADVVKKWHKQFAKLQGVRQGVDILNATRETVLKEFPLVSLEEALERR